MILSKRNILCQEPKYDSLLQAISVTNPVQNFLSRTLTLTRDHGWIVENRGVLGAKTAIVDRASCVKRRVLQQHTLVNVENKTSLQSYCSHTMNIVRAAKSWQLRGLL